MRLAELSAAYSETLVYFIRRRKHADEQLFELVFEQLGKRITRTARRHVRELPKIAIQEIVDKVRPPEIEEFRMSEFLKFDTRFRRANSPPCITARRGGCVTNQMVRSHRKRRSRGGFPSRSFHSENHPGLAISGGFAAFS